MANMGAMLTNLTTRMEGYEKRQEDSMDDRTTSHTIFIAQPEACTSHAAPGRDPARQVLAETHDVFPDVAKEVRAQVVQRLQGDSHPVLPDR